MLDPPPTPETPGPTDPPRRCHPNWISRGGPLFRFGLLLGIAAAILLASVSRGGVTSFSPFTLQYQSQTELTILWGEFRIYRSPTVFAAHPFLETLQSEGLVTAVVPERDRQEILSHWSYAWKDGHGPLYRLIRRHRTDLFDWSRANPELAKLYWTEGFRFLRSHDQKSICVGQEILRLGQSCQSVEELEDRITAIRKEVDQLLR